LRKEFNLTGVPIRIVFRKKWFSLKFESWFYSVNMI
jgi:hypothetical protein